MERDSSLCMIDFDNGITSETYRRIVVTGVIDGSGKSFSYIVDVLATMFIEPRFNLESTAQIHLLTACRKRVKLFISACVITCFSKCRFFVSDRWRTMNRQI